MQKTLCYRCNGNIGPNQRCLDCNALQTLTPQVLLCFILCLMGICFVSIGLLSIVIPGLSIITIISLIVVGVGMLYISVPYLVRTRGRKITRTEEAKERPLMEEVGAKKLTEEITAGQLAEEKEKRLAQEEAERIAEVTEAKRLGDGDKLFSLANKSANAGRSDEAIDLFVSAIRSNPWKYCGVGRGSYKPAQAHQQRLWLEGMKAAGFTDLANAIVNPPRPSELTIVGLAKADKEVEKLLDESCRHLVYRRPGSDDEKRSSQEFNREPSGIEDMVGKSIILGGDRSALPSELDPSECSDEDFVKIVPGFYAIDKVEYIAGRKWVHLKQEDGTLMYKAPEENV